MSPGRRGSLIVPAVLAIAAGAMACGASDKASKQDETAISEVVTVTAQNKSFTPDSITVPAGAATTVVFRNDDTVEHTFTVFDGSDSGGEVVADSGRVLPGETTEVIMLFGRPGTNAFQCQIHPNRMQGHIGVQ